MRFMVLVKGNAQTEQGVMPTAAELEEMGRFNDELIKAGVMLAGDGLHPSSRAKRVRFDGKNHSTVIDGPFAEAKELVAGYWLWQCKSMEEAVQWLRRAPFREGEVELRPVFELSDFPAVPDNVKKQYDAMRPK